MQRLLVRLKRPTGGWIVAATLVCLTRPTAAAAIIANYDPAVNQRFTDADDPNPVYLPNPTFQIDESRIRGIGINSRAALITPRHYITAAHASSFTPSFRGSDGVVRTYTTIGSTTFDTNLDGDNLGPSDVRLFTLTNPIPASDGITPLAVLDVEGTLTATSLAGETILSYAQNERLGRNLIDGVVVAEFDTGTPRPTYNVFYRFDTDTNGGTGGLSDELGLLGGDSGRPGLIDVDGTLALVGSHFGIEVPMGSSAIAGDQYFSLTSLISPYLDEIEAVTLAQGGYMLNRATLTAATAVPEPTTMVTMLTIVAVFLRKTNSRRNSKAPKG